MAPKEVRSKCRNCRESAASRICGRNSAVACLNFQAKLSELPQRLGVPARVVHGIVGMRGDTEFLPLGRLGCVFDQAGIEVADAPAGKSGRVVGEKAMEVVIDELPSKRGVVRKKTGAPLGGWFHPGAN